MLEDNNFKAFFVLISLNDCEGCFVVAEVPRSNFKGRVGQS